MKFFLSAGEPSGDLHGSNLAKALSLLSPGLELAGFGGPKMAAVGCRLLFPLVDYAIVGIPKAIQAIPQLLRLLAQAEAFFEKERPDALVMIDYPGFHWWLAARARRHGIPVIYYVPPQIWAWARWRVRKMRRLVDLTLCNFPFEEKWFSENGVNAKLIGHPYYDEILQQKLDLQFLAEQKQQGGIPVGLLPGSRNQEVERNTPSLIRAAGLIFNKHPSARFLFACFSQAQQKKVDAQLAGSGLPVLTFTGKTPEIISLSTVCAAVSGSVSLELLCAEKPSTIMYRASKIGIFLTQLLKAVPYITLVNLLARKELYPESFGSGCPAEWIAGHINGWLAKPDTRLTLEKELRELKNQVVFPGASQRGAEEILRWINPARQIAA